MLRTPRRSGKIWNLALISGLHRSDPSTKEVASDATLRVLEESEEKSLQTISYLPYSDEVASMLRRRELDSFTIEAERRRGARGRGKDPYERVLAKVSDFGKNTGRFLRPYVARGRAALFGPN